MTIPGILDSAGQQGFLYALAVLGVVLSLRIANWPDLTGDGTFALGGAVLATLIVAGYSPFLATAIAAVAGFLAGSLTVFLNRKLGISRILSGILVMLVLYSVNLRIMGSANVSLLRIPTIFGELGNRGVGDPERLAVFGTIASAFFLATSYFLISRIGLFIRAAGDNESMVQELGVNTNWLYLLGLGLSNALIAISGALVAQSQGFADVGMGTGLVVTAIAALILGEGFLAGIGAIRKVISTVRLKTRPRNLVTSQLRLLPWNILVELVAAVVGALLYFSILSICLRLGLAPTDLKLATGILVIGGLAIQRRAPTIETYERGRL